MTRLIASIILSATIAAPAFADDFSDAKISIPPARVTLSVDASAVVRSIDPHLLGGINIAGWTMAAKYASPSLRALTADMQPGVIRLPGGSWGDSVFWNGNGMRGPDGDVDPSRVRDGYPLIDYSAYAPCILVDNNGHPHKGWQCNSDVKTMHDFIHAMPNCQQMPIVNAGTGRPIDAAEWVKWANKKMGYNIKYWEVGNELDGSWEAGHFLPNGKELTGEMYAQRYKAIARAMKAVDPTIMVGGAAAGLGFTEAMLRDAGDDVDFVSVHMYPGTPSIPAEEQFEAAKEAPNMAQRVKALIAKYQPKRADQIKLAITEWSAPGHNGGVDIGCALWAGVFLREAVLSGYDILTRFEWEGLSEPLVQPEKDHEPDYNGVWRPRAEYWALWLWNHYTGDKLLSLRQDGSISVRALATRSDDALYLMLINGDPNRPAAASVNIRNFDPAGQGESAVLSTQSYFWNYVTHRVEWSNPPTISAIQTGSDFDVQLPALSIVCLRIPSATHPQLSALAQQNIAAVPPASPQLRMVLPTEAYIGDHVEGWVEAVDSATEKPIAENLAPAQITIDGPAFPPHQQVPIIGSVGRFFIRASGPGNVTVTAALDSQSITSSLIFKPSIPKPIICWGFDQFKLKDDFHSDFSLVPDISVRPNKCVARIDLPAAPPAQGGLILVRDGLPGPDKLDLPNVRGVVFDFKTSRDFACADPNAHMQVVMQSSANWWMVLGDVPLAHNSDWATHKIMFTDTNFIKAMPFAGSLRFLLISRQPAHGSIYYDNIGFMVR